MQNDPSKGTDISALQRDLQQAHAQWQAAPNAITQLPDDEKRKRLGYIPGPNELSLAHREQRAKAGLAAGVTRDIAALAAYDWRNVGGRNLISAVKDQGSCGACTAFGIIAMVEALIRIRYGMVLDLSEAHFYYCLARAQGCTCSGATSGWAIEAALDAFKAAGVVADACFPYTARDQGCANSCAGPPSVTKITNWRTITDPAAMKAWISTSGPLTTCLTVYDDFYAYSTGVYHHVSGGQLGGHTVCCIGYDDATRCWICKNSWGTGWGSGGYFRIAYGECGIDAVMWAVDGVTGPWQAVPPK